MSHSYAQPTDLPCPHCNQTFHAELWQILDAAERPNLLDRLRRGELHTITCPHCGHTAEANTPCRSSSQKNLSTWEIQAGRG